VNDLKIENNQGAQRWEAYLDQHMAVAEYRRRRDTVFFIHTEVPRELEGRGVASMLVKAALDDARTQHLAVVPFCPFVAGYIRRHPEYKALVHPDYRDLVEEE
jgi:predicted GNAT family acetyltransferase